MSGLSLHPVGVCGSRYVFRLADGTERAVTLLALSSRGTLLALFGGDDTWLRQSFPGQVMVVGGRPTPVGIDCLAAARFLAGLCLDAHGRRVTPPRRVVQATWWGQLCAWLARRRRRRANSAPCRRRANSAPCTRRPGDMGRFG
ncbi:hypothetical protein [Rhodopila sp.]|uniref:hypothetical protein n=1 Tax=Rhodopila sp. TaxID=2480087 RepID=UPI003D0F214B